MAFRRTWLPLCFLFLASGAGAATEVGTATLADGAPRLLRGVTWYKLVPGIALEEGDIVTLAGRGQVQVELADGSIVNLTDAGALYLAPAANRAAPRFDLRSGWLKAMVRPPGMRVRTLAFDVVMPEGALVLHALPAATEAFSEAGSARLFEVTASGADGAAHDAKRGEYWSRAPAGTFTTVARAPKSFVDVLPRGYTDSLPVLAAKLKSKPALVADGEITYAEAEPWLAGPDRAAFERRFTVRLRDPAFRQAVAPHVARYPSWDRMLHPEKYKPKEGKSP